MKSKLTLTAAVAGIALLTVGGTMASNYYGQKQHELSGEFCKELKDEKVYSTLGLEYYKMLIAGKEGWIFRTENDFRREWNISQKTIDYLLSLQDAFRKKNAELIIVTPPVRGMVHYAQLFEEDAKKYFPNGVEAEWKKYESYIKKLRDSGINIVGIPKDKIKDGFYYSRNHHWSAVGAHQAAEAIAVMAKNTPIYEQIPKIEFSTQKLAQPVAYDTSFEKAFRKICGSKIPPEGIARYVTSPKKSAPVNEGELFAERPAPQVVILGTSNSIDESAEANFEGFVKQALSVDVLNKAIIGAGIDTSIMAYVNSKHFQNGAPKIVIWEIPGYYDLNYMDDKLFNQVIPAAYGSCEDKSLATTIYADLQAGINVILNQKTNWIPVSFSAPSEKGFTVSDFNMNDNNKYLHLSFDAPVKKKFSIKFQYGNKGTKRQDFHRDPRYPKPDGEFYTLLPHDMSAAKLENILLVLPKELKGRTASLEFCNLPRSEPL